MEIVIYSLSSCFALFSFYKLHKENEGRRKFQYLCILVLLVVNIFLFHYMIKCYEVPIHNNRISYFISNKSKYDSFTGYSDIEFVYDYNTFKELKKTNHLGERIYNEPGIKVSTYIKCNDDKDSTGCYFTTSYSYFENGVEHDNFSGWDKDGYKKLVEDKSYTSFLEKNNVKPSLFEIDESANRYSFDGVLFMLEINSSNRQSFLFKLWKNNSRNVFYEYPKFESSLLAEYDSLAPHHDTVYYNNEWIYFHCLKPTINSMRERDYRFIPEQDSILYQSLILYKTGFEKPNLFTTAEDISQTVEVLWIDNGRDSAFNNNIKKIKYDYNGPVEFSDISPVPDYIDISSLYYTDSLKIKAIEENGLKFHVKFPDMENLQIIRMWMVTLLLGGFLGLLLKIVYNLLKESYSVVFMSSIKKHKKLVTNLTIAVVVIALIYIVLIMLIMSHVNAFDLYDDRFYLIIETP